jgi:hypothetical protein
MNLVLCFQSCDWVMMRCHSKTYIHMKGEEIIELELSIDELVDATLGINHAQGLDLNVDLHSIDVDHVAPPTVMLSDANVMHHCCLISY